MQFTKLHGLGNSYIFVDLFSESLENKSLSELAVAVANPDTGIGSDGLILVGPSEAADVRMRIFNADGSEAMNCGNGVRASAKLAYEKKRVLETSFTVETNGGIVTAFVHPDEQGMVHEVTVDMGKPKLNRQEIPLTAGGPADEQHVNKSVQTSPVDEPFTAVGMGNPHAVIFVDDIAQAPVVEDGPKLECASFFPDRVNVEYIEMITPQEMNFKVWERGSGVTQACGTGACAAVVAAVLNKQASFDEEVTVHLPGGDLHIRWNEMDRHVWMRGPAELICTGAYYL
ncbi:diaminopimelate epimerase [Salsuginibacillus halophilus]|uniref:Diaminopimelate epimerase n=1 Tax=Salsuginibacillus halophilus TaxID=517424 RepID=A0A2P8HE69_9BACI|nr:diaminopimelate epimerase [Salsuginibacillus halophilus]PSL44461.1 diaminopimelate epimerase [Salsuginibacillus halophilus]